MSAAESPVYVEGSPSVVIDEVGMHFWAESTAPAGGRRGVVRKLLGRPTMVKIMALRPMSLVVERGESVGVIGRNGSGKSTLMKLVSGQLKPTTGAVYASSPPVLLGVNAALMPDLSGDQNVILGCLAMGMSRAQAEAKYDDIVELSGLGESIHRPMKGYSAGMGSRLRFAIAAAVDPEILIVDEALNTGDAQFANRSKARMDELREQAGCVFLVSHSLQTVSAMCTRVIWLDKGDLLMDGDPKEAVELYEQFTTHLSKGNNLSAAKIRDEARSMLVATRVLERASGRRRLVAP